MELTEYQVTFGVQYGRREQHPTLPGVTGNHYVTVVARDEEEARIMLALTIGLEWAFMYSPVDNWDPERYAPQGEFARLGWSQ